MRSILINVIVAISGRYVLIKCYHVHNINYLKRIKQVSNENNFENTESKLNTINW